MESLTNAFQTMRKAGLLARQNFWCCGSCAGYAMAQKATELIDKGKDVQEIKGCVFYHNQDNERKRNGKNFHLAFGQLGSEKYGDIGLATKEVGRLVCQILSVFNITFKWDGKAETRIEILQEETV